MIGAIYALAIFSLVADPSAAVKDGGRTTTVVPPTDTAVTAGADTASVGGQNDTATTTDTAAIEDYTVLSSDLSGITFVYRPRLGKVAKGEKPRLDKLPAILNCMAETDPGRPLLPRRIFHIAVPTGYLPRVSAKAYDERFLGRFSVPRAPDYKVVEIDGIKTMEPIPAATALPSRPETASLLSFGMGRGLGIAAIAVYPLQVDETEHLSAKTKIIVRVDFVPNPKAPAVNKELALPRTSDPEGLAANILNYKQIAPYCPVRGEIRATPENSPVMTPHQIPQPAYKIYIKDQGMVRISGTWLINNGVDLNSINPENIKVYGSDGDPLPEDGTFAPKAINEVAVDMHDGGDGKFDPDDWFTFYGFGTYYLDTNLSWHRNQFTDYNVFWLSLGGSAGKRMINRDVTPSPSAPAATFRDRAFGEQDVSFWGVENALKPGEDVFYWAYSTNAADGTTTKFFVVPTPGTAHVGTAHLSAQIKGLFGSTHHVYIYVGSAQNPANLIFEGTWGFQNMNNIEVDFPGNLLTSDTTQLVVREVNESTASEQVLYNYFRITYERRYEANTDRLLFLPPYGQPNNKTYLISNITTPNFFLYEVNNGEVLTNYQTDILGPIRNVRFTDPVGGNRRFALVAPGRFVTPVGLRPKNAVPLPDDSTGADLIYITHPKYSGKLDPLISFRRTQGWRVVQVFMDDICDEYAAGLLDPTAIRNFLQHAYTSWQGNPPSMVALVGECTYDYREIINKNAHNDLYASWGWNEVPTHHQLMPSEDTAETATDNWLVCFDGPTDEVPEMAVARISPDTQSELDHMVQKFVSFEQNPNLGDWRMYNTYVADNDCIPLEQGDFTHDAENFFSGVMPAGQSAKKMYLESVGFPEDWIIHDGHQGERQTMARQDFTPVMRTHFDGIITQYGGHGARQLWAHERILWERIGTSGGDIRDIEDLTNLTRYPLVFMLSCSTCEYDAIPEVLGVVGSGDSLGEYFTRISEHGGIAAIGSTRVSNELHLNMFQSNFYRSYFPGRTLPTNPMTLGQGFFAAKLLTDLTGIRATISMMGDPATVLPVPRLNTNLTPSVKVVARGGVLNVTGTVSNPNFEGKAEVFLEDSVFYYNSKELETYPYDQLVRVVKPRRMSLALASVHNGRFTAMLPIPTAAAPLADISSVAVRTYIWNDQTKVDGCNRTEVNLDIQGTLPSEDRDGPLITIGLNSGPFRDGDMIASHSRFRVRLSDPSGILIAPDGDPLNPTSHPINAVIAGQANLSIDCTGYYVPDTDNYQLGTVEFPVYLEAGSYTLTMVASDSLGNQSQKTVTFTVGSGLAITNPLVCPNPVVDQTYFTFNLSNYATSGKISIYTVSGRLVRSLDVGSLRAGYNEVSWDARDSRGNRLANGCYFYVLTVRDGVSKSTIRNKFLVMR